MSRQTNWRRHAACRNADPELFFPEGAAGPTLETAEQAKRFCRTCHVRARCLDWALSHGAAFGIWGGRTQDERRAFRAGPAQQGQAETTHADERRS
jgi:WhiB family redox-sensing transcriptional regulator